MPKEFELTLLFFVVITLIFGKIGGIITPIVFGISMGFIGFMILLILYLSNQIKKNYLLIILFSFNFSVVLGFLIELSKYYLKLLLNQPITEQIYQFSMTNMSYVILGAIISSIIGFAYMKSKKEGLLSRFVKKIINLNPNIFKKETYYADLKEIIEKGESEDLEFKSTLRVNLHTNEIDKKIENSILKTLTGFLNSKGGTLLIGVDNTGKITGIEKDHFENSDKFNLHLVNIIKKHLGKNALSNINFETITKEEQSVEKVECKKSKKPIFMNMGEIEEFYIRIGPSTQQIKGSELVEYIEKRFKK